MQPDYRHVEAVLRNERPQRLPLYEHIVSPRVMERVLGARFVELLGGKGAELDEYFQQYCRFFRETGYDVASFEICINSFVPGHGAISGGRPGPIQTRADFESFPWDEIPVRYWEYAEPRFRALARNLPEGMKAIGGVGNGVFEISEDLVGLEYLPFMQVDDPELYRDLYARIGELMSTIWARFLRDHSGAFVGCRFGDDLGFKTSLLTNPGTVRQHIVPQYRRVIGQVHDAGKRFLWHSCGCVFEVMADMIAAGIDAKHSNEDAIATFDRWIGDYGDRIGLFGGFDMDFLCQQPEDRVFEAVVEFGTRFRATARGYALGSGNSIPDYVPLENYLAMVNGARHIREREAAG